MNPPFFLKSVFLLFLVSVCLPAFAQDVARLERIATLIRENKTVEAERQLRDNKVRLEEITGRSCTTVAYPSGDYNADVLDVVRAIGFDSAFATTPSVRQDRAFEISRMGIYAASVEAMGFKIFWGDALRSAGVRVG